jgi:lysophospholipase L1-like esterase
MTKENKPGTVLILGDSTSMSIGLERQTHTFINADKHIWPSDTTIVNSSLPGMTAADSAAFYFRHKKKELKNLKAVLIYLGNCDTTSTEVRKRKYSKLVQLKDEARELMNMMPAKTSIKNRLLYFEWNNTFNPKIESPEYPEDFEFNIERIIRDCRLNNTPVIIVRPKANQFFPSGIGKGNFSFYKYLGINDKIANQISIPDSRFKKALAFQEAGNFLEAAALYKEILIKPHTEAMSQEYSLLVSNNYAVAKAQSGSFEEAIYLLQLLLKEAGVRKEIILFNLSQIKKIQGDQQEAKRMMTESFESDTSLYRVRNPYIQAVDALAKKYPFVKMVDMYELIPDNYYLDHCHPLPEGQHILADAIEAKFSEVGVKGDCKAGINNVLYNPEFANGNKSFFHDYFKTFAPYTESEISEQVDAFRKAYNESVNHSSIPEVNNTTRELRTAFEYYLRHPIFTSFTDILKFPPKYPSDIGRFPEYFFIRHIIPYLAYYESMENNQGDLSFQHNILRTSADLLSILPEESRSLVDKQPPAFDACFEEKRIELILAKVHKQLLQHLSIGNQIYNRTKSTIFWYVRETLRFGSHSRYSMRYDRVQLEYLAEGLAVARIINSHFDNKHKNAINDLVNILNVTISIHEEYCDRFDLSENNSNLLKDYDKALEILHNQLINK